jgi:23S rRNA (pseudouridine1915-N3)-methyltransferase
MRLIVAGVGKLKQGPERELFTHYWQRLEAAGRAVAFSPIRLDELGESRAASSALRKSDEAQRLLRAGGEADVRVVLDERGKSLTSEALASWIKARRDGGAKAMAFLIGGPDGHGAEVLDGADLKLSLGALTLPHGLARIVLVEQLYRATTIIAGHPYHRA